VPIPYDSGSIVAGEEVVWGVLSATATSPYSVVPGAPELKSLQIGVLPEAARPYRQQLLGFVLLDVVGRDLVKAELRLVVNEVRDPAVRLGERKLQIFHLAAPRSTLARFDQDVAVGGSKVLEIGSEALPRRGSPLVIDVTAAVKAQLATRGRPVAIFRLELQDALSLDPEEPAFVQFLGFHGNVADSRPQLELRFE
jgi:hypothetical protein